MITKQRTISLITIGYFLLAGCGEKPFTHTVPVRGLVTLEGKPLANELITFQPFEISDNRPRRPSVVPLREDGTFNASSYRDGDGLVPGKYRVAILSGQAIEAGVTIEASPIPQRYSDPSTSGLTVEVPADSPLVEIQFDLTE